MPKNLEIEVVEATELAAADLNGKSDPYCILETDQSNKKTKTIKKTLEPQWNEKFKMTYGVNLNLKVKVFDYDFITSDDLIGSTVVNLDGLEKGTTKDEWYDLKPQGKIHLKLTLV
eukprot:TRINITY_DN31930_c0_g1_i1.p1 TRINITY_DN31930_c0_g1~~TRINITY_DN31930_c0_g1_i1.p1  ORF type:complete len:116 (+),score=26.69 TRINITY_DN31930_c0_g1_i1:37-384(+)